MLVGTAAPGRRPNLASTRTARAPGSAAACFLHPPARAPWHAMGGERRAKQLRKVHPASTSFGSDKSLTDSLPAVECPELASAQHSIAHEPGKASSRGTPRARPARERRARGHAYREPHGFSLLS